MNYLEFKTYLLSVEERIMSQDCDVDACDILIDVEDRVPTRITLVCVTKVIEGVTIPKSKR